MWRSALPSPSYMQYLNEFGKKMKTLVCMATRNPYVKGTCLRQALYVDRSALEAT